MEAHYESRKDCLRSKVKREPCEEGRRVHSEKKKIREIILAAMIDCMTAMWIVC